MGCCKEQKCGQCPKDKSGQKLCKKDSDCKSEIQGFTNTQYFKINDLSEGSYTAAGEYVCNKEDKNLSKWIHQEGKMINGKPIKEGPVFMFNKIVEKYGKPDIIVNKARGICIWYIENKNGDPHHSIELKDEYVSHCVPAQHHDFLYSYIKIYVPPEKIKQVLSVSGSVGYDGLQKLLYARCASFEANMATLASVFLVLNNKDPNYVFQIKNRYDSFENNKKYVIEELNKNNKKYKEKFKDPYYDLAFPNGCSK